MGTYQCDFKCDIDSNECCDGDGDCVQLEDWSNWQHTVSLHAPEGIINSVEGAINKLIDIEVNELSLNFTGQSKDCCDESDNIGIIEDGERYQEGSLTISAEIEDLYIWGPLRIDETFDFYFGSVWIDFEAGIKFEADFTAEGTIGKRWDDCSDPAEDCVYATAEVKASPELVAKCQAIICQDTDWTSPSCIEVTVQPASISAQFLGEVSFNSRDVCDNNIHGDIKVGAVVFSASFKIGIYEETYTYTFYDGDF